MEEAGGEKQNNSSSKGRGETYSENAINLTLLDPPRFGWTAVGGVADLSTPHERARRKSTKKAFINARRAKKRDRREAFSRSSLTEEIVASNQQTEQRDGTTTLNTEKAPETTTKTAESLINGVRSQAGVEINGVLNEDENDILKQKPFVQGRSTAEHAAVLPEQKSQEVSKNEEVKDVSSSTTLQNHLVDSTKLTTGKRQNKLFFRALQEDNDSIDVDMYHRGRQGHELRDEHNGDLLYDVDATDTNHAAEEPKSLVANIKIEFPLEDTVNGIDTEPRFFREIVSWDLSNPETPNPNEYGCSIAKEFGLNYIQKTELVESIQEQLLDFVQEHCIYAPPLLAGPVYDRPTPLAPQLYGEVTGLRQYEGFLKPVVHKPKPVSTGHVQRSGSFSSTRNSTKQVGKLPGKRRSSETQKVEDIYIHQVRKRLHDASILYIQERSANEGQKGSRDTIGKIVYEENSICHICRTRDKCGRFGCAIASHTFCEKHMNDLCGVAIDQERTAVLEYCPVCSLSCTCTDCSSKLDFTALEFKKKTIDQKVTPERTAFVNLRDFCLRLDPHRCKEKQDRDLKNNRRKPSQKTVEKLSSKYFPREVADGVDMDSGFEAYYRTKFTEDGSFVITTEISENGSNQEKFNAQTEKAGHLEDGSVDFCMICNKVGNLLCCDFCPRAYHDECLPKTEQQAVSEGDEWECPKCKEEKKGVPGDKVDGSTSLGIICETYGVSSSLSDTNGIKLLSILHEMLQRLMEYDFGYMFRVPVDLKQIPTYKTIVKNPMDLGTITASMLNGGYPGAEENNNPNLELIAVSILKDIELVWHNCFLFNVEGSAVYRMADVQRRKASKIRERSFEYLLCQESKDELRSYVASLCQEREEYRRLEQPNIIGRSPKGNSPARHKILAPARRAGVSKPVVLLDPDSGMLVKVYSTISSAFHALSFLLTLKQDCEWEKKEIDTQPKLRKLLLLSAKDANVRLYGYRWLFLDDLRQGLVSFKVTKTKSAEESVVEPVEPAENSEHACLFQMVENEISYYFNSADEALSCPTIHDKYGDLRERLLKLEPDGDFSNLDGRLWRAFSQGDKRDNYSVQDRTCPDDIRQLVNVKIVKEDLITGERVLVGFQNVEAAYRDWLETLEASVYPYEGPKSMDIFLSFYLDGERNIDGIRWRNHVQVVEDQSASADEEKMSVSSVCENTDDEPESISRNDNSNFFSKPSALGTSTESPNNSSSPKKLKSVHTNKDSGDNGRKFMVGKSNGIKRNQLPMTPILPTKTLNGLRSKRADSDMHSQSKEPGMVQS